MKYKYIFGPVASRRLGLSLGVDFTKSKICTFNCIYCECGKTKLLTSKIKEYVKEAKITKELKSYLKNKPKLDYITFTASGEPSLNSKLFNVAKYIKDNYKTYKLALITNSSLLHKSKDFREFNYFDVIMPSLDAVSKKVFLQINRPEKESTDPLKIIEGLIKLRKYFKGKIWLEIFIVPKINDTVSEIKKLNNQIKKIKPDLIQINTLDRPGTVNIMPADKKTLLKIKRTFGKNAKIIASAGINKSPVLKVKEKESMIIATIERRPSTIKDITSVLNIKPFEVKIIIGKLLFRRIVKSKKLKRGTFYFMPRRT